MQCFCTSLRSTARRHDVESAKIVRSDEMLYAEPSLKIAQIFCDDERLGFSPGDLTEKVNPYLRPFYDARHDMMTQQ